MKLTKISLAALVALGVFSSVASATSLEDAIKNVDLTGYARYRYTYADTKNTQDDKTHTANHEFKTRLNFKAAYDDNFFGFLQAEYVSKDGSANTGEMDSVTHKAIGDFTDTKSGLVVRQVYLGYKAGNTTITAGKQEVGSIFTDNMVGTGLKVVNQDIEGLTLAAVAFDALEKDGDIKTSPYYTKKGHKIPGTNLYAVGAIGSYDPVGFQLWYAHVDQVAGLIGAELSTTFDVADDLNLHAKAQYVHSNVKELYDNQAATNKVNTTNGDFYAIELGTKISGFNIDAGFVNFKAKDASDGSEGTSVASFEDDGQLITAGEQIINSSDYAAFSGKNTYLFAKLGYTYDKLMVGAEYIKGFYKFKDDKTKRDEWVARASYAYSKKIKFSSYYSRATEKQDGHKDKFNKFRFEAKYTF